MKQNDRLNYLDMAKGIGILCVIIGHYFGMLQGYFDRAYIEPLYKIISSFHMPLFFMVSGFLVWITKEETKSFRVIVLKKIRMLLIPYATFSLTYLAIEYFGGVWKHTPLSFLDLKNLILCIVTGRGISVLWFLPALFLSEILFLFLLKKAGKYAAIISAALGVIGVLASPVLRLELWTSNYGTVQSALFTLLRSLAAVLFLQSGYALSRFLEGRQGSFVKEGLLFLFFATCLIVLCEQNETVDMNYMIFGNPLLFYVSAFSGVCAVILFCRLLRTCKLLEWLGKNSLVIMATHVQFGILGNALAVSLILLTKVRLATDNVWCFDTLLFVVTMGLVLVSECIVVYIYNHYLVLLLGKKYLFGKSAQ